MEGMQCPHCDYMAKDQADLDQHMMQTHPDMMKKDDASGSEMGIKCPQCDYVAKDQADLDKHTMEVHGMSNGGTM